jgi:hypothetical protein
VIILVFEGSCPKDGKLNQRSFRFPVLKNKIKREAVDVKQILDQIAETLLPEKDFEIAIKNTRDYSC